MPKTYYNNAIAGNSKLLACLDGRGELVRLFWPNIDYPQHIDRFCCGIYDTLNSGGAKWLHGEEFVHGQRYLENTNIAETSYESAGVGLRVVSADFAPPGEDMLVRRFSFENISDRELSLGFIVYSSAVSTNPQPTGTLFDFEHDALIHYRHGYYISIGADKTAHQFQIGNNSFEAARSAVLGGYESIGMSADGAVSWLLGSIPPGGRAFFTLYICASGSLKGVKKLITLARTLDASAEIERTEKYWHAFLRGTRRVTTGRAGLDALYYRSVLVFRLMWDENCGGLLAAPELDEEFTRCGRYAYCWGRDAAFITSAMDKCGLTSEVEKFYRWAAGAQEASGVWQQRYHMDGNLAPSWGLQIDETGSIVWGILKHYEATKNRAFLFEMWECVRRAVDFLCSFRDGDTGLPALSYDLWEERLGEHAYSAAAVWGGIRAGAEIASLLGFDGAFTEEWKRAAADLKKAVESCFWREEQGRFLRSVRIKLNPWGSEPSESRVHIKVNPKGFYRDFTLEDPTMDVSLLGLSVPYGLYTVDDPRMVKTAAQVESLLAAGPAGGIKRYENDSYIGGNPWIIATLWLALFHLEGKDYGKAKEYLEWAATAATELGLLPEQVDRETGKPAWVIPLTWSHAMFVLVLSGLYEAGEL